VTKAPRLIRPVAAPATVPPALDGAWAPSDTRLDDIELFPLPSGTGPEDVAIDPAGRLISGDRQGHLWRWQAEPRPDQPPELLAETGGRPLGIEVNPGDGSLVVCDAFRGLLRVTDDGAITSLCTEVAGRRLMLCNNATIARDGTVFFTDSSDRYPVTVYKRDLLEYRPNGRLLAYRPGGSTEVVTEGLYFPNGVALTPDETAIMLVETGSHRLSRVPLATGTPELLADLPAYPDNVGATGDGTYWIALPSPRVKIAERLLPYPRLRQLAALLPDRLQPQPAHYSIAALVDGDGSVLRTLHGPRGRYFMLTGVRQHGDVLWLGSLAERGIARVPL
jgi:sugar lactone lactonase YvrE